MSEVKDKFYELFTPKMEVKGFTFKKSAGDFIKIQSDVKGSKLMKMGVRQVQELLPSQSNIRILHPTPRTNSVKSVFFFKNRNGCIDF